MRFRAIVLALVALIATSALASAQSQVGEIFGKATDQSGAVLPGVTVTLTAPTLLQPQVAVTSETGTYQFPRLAIGTYTVKFELTGFKTVVMEGVEVTVGFSAQINGQMGVSTVQETITVTGQSPIVDTRNTGTHQTFTNELLQSIPSARDPWVVLQQTAGVAMDRENIGGNMSGQQSNYVSRGGNPFNNKWSLDGIDITDMAATGSSPTYYDFDAFEEMTINTGGVDVTQQTGGVGINLVTKSGSDRFRGSSRYYRTNDKFESQNITDEQRKQGASSGGPIQDIKDYGIEAGGPLKKGRAWIWGSYGKQDINVGVLGFFQPTAACQAIKANPLNYEIAAVNDCLNADTTLLQTTNLKGEVQLFKGNKLSLFNLFSKKERNARNASDLTPIESTVRQAAVPSTYGRSGWTTGPSPTYKFGDQWVVSDRLLLDVQYAHVGNNFILNYHDDSLATVQPTFIISTSLNGRSTPDNGQSVNIRPVNQVNANVSYFVPGLMHSDHSFKFGGYWKDAYSYGATHTPGFAVARFPNAVTDNCAVLTTCQAQVTRDGLSRYDLKNISLYAQDTVVKGRLTAQLGLRYDYNHDQVLDASVVANPLVPTLLPALSFGGLDPGIAFNDLSPRLGLTYDLRGTGKTIAKANYAMYWGQVGTGGVSFQVNPVSRVSIRYPWTDTNGDKFVQANELTITNGGRNFLNLIGNWDPASPATPSTPNTIDPNLKNDRTDEFIVGLDHEIGLGFAAGVNYIWRRYSGFQVADTVGLTPADWVALNFTPTAASCPAGARCPTVTYYQPTFQVPTTSNLTNATSDQYNRTFNGVELTARKRMSHHWLMNTSFAYNSTIVNNGDPGVFANAIFEDPTNRTTRDGFQYDYLTAGSGLGNTYVNAKYLFKISGLYNLPFDFNVSAFYNNRQGYIFEPVVQSPSRLNGAGIATVLLDGVGDNRLPTFQNLDFHVERPIKMGHVRFNPSLDVFNVANSNTVLALQRTQNSAIANNISQIVAPRIARFGIRVTW
jgi:Carboxypeptidase regulatory-like domain/TonB-dependent Receptor Plug Domain